MLSFVLSVELLKWQKGTLGSNVEFVGAAAICWTHDGRATFLLHDGWALAADVDLFGGLVERPAEVGTDSQEELCLWMVGSCNQEELYLLEVGTDNQEELCLLEVGTDSQEELCLRATRLRSDCSSGW